MAERERYQRWAEGRAPEALSADLFAGRLVIFSDLESVRTLRERACEIVEAIFGSDDPDRAEARLDPDDFKRATTAARRRIRTDAAIDACWRAVLDDVGYGALETYRDRVRLRVVPSRPAAQSRFARPLPAHRDSWGSGIAAQVNWWLPLYALSARRTMLIWPDLFDTAVANTAAAWDYEEIKRGRHKDYPMLPEAREEPAKPGVPVVIEPGSLLAFSAAHLHASASDRSGRTRFSLDARTVWARDIAAGRGAPDVDSAGKPPRWDMFARVPAPALERVS